MKACIIGNSGHGMSALEDCFRLGITISAYCSGYEGEPLEPLERFFVEHGLSARRCAGLEAMLEEYHPDLLIIDNRFGDHFEAEIAALRKGIPAFCDKPLALRLEDCDELERAERESSATVWAMQTLRYAPWFYTAKKLADAGVVGRVRMINVQKSYKLGQRPPFFSNREFYGGTICWVAIHGIDLIRYFCRERVTSVYAKHSAACNGGNGSLETAALCLFTMEREVLAHVNADYCRPMNAPTHGDDRIRVAGTRGVLEVRGGQVYLIDDTHDGVCPESLEYPPTIFEDFVRFLQTREKGLLDFKDSLEATRLALLARESADSGREIRT